MMVSFWACFWDTLVLGYKKSRRIRRGVKENGGVLGLDRKNFFEEIQRIDPFIFIALLVFLAVFVDWLGNG